MSRDLTGNQRRTMAPALSEYLDMHIFVPIVGISRQLLRPRYCRHMSTKRRPGQLEWSVRSPADLGRALAGARRQRGWTQERLARELGIDRSYLSELESGSSALVLQRTLQALRRLGAEGTVAVGETDGRPR